jgi:hypothetical protein
MAEQDAPNNRITTEAAPTGEALTDEQATFEADYLRRFGTPGYLRRDQDGAYGHLITRTRWEGWKARAALAAHPAPSASAPAQPTEEDEPLPMARYNLNQSTARMEESPNGRWVFYNAVRGAAPAQPVVPAGWRLVPVEPTPEMHSAYWKAASRLLSDAEFPAVVYRAMLAIAPSAEAQPTPKEI